MHRRATAPASTSGSASDVRPMPAPPADTGNEAKTEKLPPAAAAPPSSSASSASQQTTTTGFLPIRMGKALARAAYGGICSVWGWGRDVYRLKKQPGEFILGEMYQRATQDSNVTWVTTMPGLVSKCSFGYFPTRVYVISGTKANIMEVGDYGEASGDRAARFFFGYVDKMIGRPTLMTRLGPAARHEKTRLRKHMINAEPLEFAAETARSLFKKVVSEWKPGVSYQDQMTYLGANVLGRCLLGVPELPMRHIPILRDIGRVLLDPKQDAKKIQRCALFLASLNRELFADPETRAKILAEEKFISDDLDYCILEDEKDEDLKNRLLASKPEMTEYLKMKREELQKNPEALLQKLLQRKGISLFIVEGNLSATIMAAIAYLNQYPAMKERLREEVAALRKKLALSEEEELPLSALRQLSYLDCFYEETLRLLSSAPSIVRKTANATTMRIEDANGKRHVHQIPAHSVLFVPLRAIHHDPRIWGKDPLTFDPSRFEVPKPVGSESSSSMAEGKGEADPLAEQVKLVEARRKRAAELSAGQRSCPAQAGFAATVVKTLVIAALEYDFRLDHSIETVPTHTLEPHWHLEYHAEVTPAERPKSGMKLAS